jgi:hypothetical protein
MTSDLAKLSSGLTTIEKELEQLEDDNGFAKVICSLSLSLSLMLLLLLLLSHR